MNQYLLHHLLEKTATRYPDRDAVIFNDNSITYTELNGRSDQLAFALSCLGVNKGDRVGLVLKKSIESLIAIFGILKAAAAYVPIDPQAPASRVKYIINNCNIKLLLTSREDIEKVIPDIDIDSSLEKVILMRGDATEFKEKCNNLEFFLWESIVLDKAGDFRYVDISDNSPAYILHTSGSTGLPKGVVISHLNSLTFVNMAAEFFGITERDRLCSHAPLNFDLSVFDIFVAVKCGAAIILVPEFLSIFPIKLAKFIDDTKISVWNSVASVFSLLTERGKLEKFEFNSLRLVLFSGEVLPVKYLRKVAARMKNAEFFNIYGQTEANSSTFYRIRDIPDDDSWMIPIGKAFPNFDVFALDDTGKIIVSPGEIGELYVSTSAVAKGYWGDAEKTKKAFIQDPRSYQAYNKIYKTGDLVKIDNQNNFVFRGRKDLQVKSRGYRVQLSEIEFVLNSYSGIKEAVVLAVPDELIGNMIVSYVSPADGANLTDVEVSGYCSTILPSYMVPEKITIMDELPKTATGKPDRKLLAKITCES